MPRQGSSRHAAKNAAEELKRYGITPGADRSDDPEARGEAEPCSIPGCNISHATRGVKGGD